MISNKNLKKECCEKNCPDYNGMSLLHNEQCDCPCHTSPKEEVTANQDKISSKLAVPSPKVSEWCEDFDKKFIPEYVKMYGNGNDIDIEKLTIPMTIGDVKQFISSRQISLIKMIVEIVESEKKEQPKRIPENIQISSLVSCYNQALDTISSKLSELTDGK